jgi:hypothetical protein
MNEKTRILLPIDDEQRHPGHQGIAHIEHAIGQPRIGMKADDGGLAGDQRVPCRNADGARLVQ